MRAKVNPLRWLMAVCLALSLSACGNKSSDDGSNIGAGGSTGGGNTGGGNTQTGRTFLIQPGPNATTEMVGAMVQAAPGDVIQFDCGYFELTSTLQLINTEDVLIKGCGKDKTVLSFKHNNAPEGILGVNVHGLWIEDLTVLDTGGNGIELRGVDHAALKRVRTMWSSGGGRLSPTPITADNAFADNAKLLNVACTDPPTQNPDEEQAPENQHPFADTTSPDYTVSKESGRYGIYPVSAENVLIEEAESIGASDAGIYVGQTSTAIIRNSRAVYNVFGFEIENVRDGEYEGNLAECNTGGFLIYDLDNLRQYGDRTRMYNNIARNNNTYNFTSGGFVGNVPPGSGMITLSYDRIDVFNNTFENNNTGGIIHASYELFPEGGGRPSERRIDWYTEGMHIWDNIFRNNGNGLPMPTSGDIQSQNVPRFFPVLVGAKNQAACLDPRNAVACGTASAGLIAAACSDNDPANCFKSTAGFRGAHILWDGLLDNYHADCEYPKDKNGDDVPMDERGKPLYSNDHPNPPCHYNAYKFEDEAPNPRIVPDWWASCIDASNDFSADSLTFANFHGTRGLEAITNSSPNPGDPASLATVVAAFEPEAMPDFPSSLSLAPHQCEQAYGSNLPPLPPVVIPPFVRSGDFDPQPNEAVVAQLCGTAVATGEVNHGAFSVNCPTLDQYHLFSDPEDPTSAPNGGGVPFALNSKLFSDYAVKYRVLFLPQGETATYRDSGGMAENVAIQFPVGTIIAKTFAFNDEGAGDLDVVETRLLIKRVNSRGVERWDGVPYIWTTDSNGKRVARLSMGGGIAEVNWDHTDVDSGVKHVGSTDNYSIPHAGQCLSCHANEDADTGAAPIGPKVRMLNRPYSSEVGGDSSGQATHAVAGQNQIAYWCQNGLLAGCPSNLAVDANGIANVERVPAFNKPGDAGFAANSDEDVEARARAWLEVNCQHCHNSRGFAANTGFYLDVLRVVDTTYGICKRPTATGQEGNGGRTYDIHPGNVGDSILPFRIGPEATTPAARMPPLARSVVDTEGHALIEQWIRDVVVKDEAKYPGSTSCGN